MQRLSKKRGVNREEGVNRKEGARTLRKKEFEREGEKEREKDMDRRRERERVGYRKGLNNVILFSSGAWHKRVRRRHLFKLGKVGEEGFSGQKRSNSRAGGCFFNNCAGRSITYRRSLNDTCHCL